MQKHYRNLFRITAVGLIAISLAGCASNTRKENNTLAGTGLGAAAGAVLSQGDPLYTLGGAAAGGVLGNILTEDRRGHGASRGGRSHAAPKHSRAHRAHHRGGPKHSRSRHHRR